MAAPATPPENELAFVLTLTASAFVSDADGNVISDSDGNKPQEN